MSKNEVAKVEKSTAVATASDYGDFAGAGFEDTKPEDLSIPFISILQSNSPQVEDGTIEGAASGMLYNTVTKELIDPKVGLIFQPCHTDSAHVEWVPRNKGGGFVGMHESNGHVVKQAIERNGGNKFGRLQTEEENDLIETHYVYGLVLDEDGLETMGFAVVSFTSTKIKPKQDWFTAMYTLKGRPPLFANRARISTVKQKNEHGTFYNFSIEPLTGNYLTSLLKTDNDAELAVLREGSEFREMVLNGMAKADFGSEQSTQGEGSSSTPDEDVPF